MGNFPAKVWIGVVPRKTHIESSFSCTAVSGGEAFRRHLGHEGFTSVYAFMSFLRNEVRSLGKKLGLVGLNKLL